jgi:peroxiredoxin family protein
MDLVLICRDASASSLLGNLLVAMEARKAEQEVAVLFTQEALAALAGGVVLWPPGLQGQQIRLAMVAGAQAMEIPVMLRGEGRQVDAAAMVEKAKQAGVPMYACPTWSQLLNTKGKLPAGIAEMDTATALKTLAAAKRVIGSL